jgi:hypothetical protein
MPNPASYLYPSIAMDDGGYLHVVFASRTDKDRPIWYSFSKDGTKWTKPVPISRGAAGYSPWIDAGKAGEAAVVWYGSPSPKATDTKEADWYFYVAHVTGADRGAPVFTSGPTTDKPIYSGKSDIPEFEMIRLDDRGLIHIGMSAFHSLVPNGPGRWAVYSQTETLRDR